MFKAVKKEVIDQHNQSHKSDLDFDFEYLEKKLQQSQIDIHKIKEQVKKFQVAVPTWGVGTGGTRFARFPGIGEPQNIYEKICFHNQPYFSHVFVQRYFIQIATTT